MQAMEMRCHCKILYISYRDHVTNKEVHAKIQQAIRPHEDMTIVKRRKLLWYGHLPFIRSGQNHLARNSDRRKTRQEGRQKKRLGKQYQGMDRPGVCQVPEGSEEQRKKEETGCEIICAAPNKGWVR